MKTNKIAIAVVAAVIFVVAAGTAIYLFRNEIADFFVDIKARIDEKILKNDKTEYID